MTIITESKNGLHASDDLRRTPETAPSNPRGRSNLGTTGLAVGLDLFQIHVHSVCLCLLPTQPSPEGLQLEDFTFVQGGD